MSRLAVRSTAAEQMDAPDLDPGTYARVLADLARVNRWTLARPPTLRFVARAVGKRRRFRLLDVGFGQGDMLRSIASWAARRGIAAELVGIDLNPGSAIVAQAATPPDLSIDFRTGDYRDQPDPFDLVVSSLVAHHMTEAELVEFLRFMEERAGLGWMVNDLHRHGLAHAAYPWIARAMRWHRIVREDGTLSIARAFRAGEWPPLLAAAGLPPGAAEVHRRFPFRLCVERTR
jgi:2-polyprenyl-3-methyl-5-hydroxy-6-metoxy-1,4-benzoquinol methylase